MNTTVTKEVNIARKVIQEGRVVAFPTGTCYGLAADALQGHALQRVRNMKRRPQEKPLSVCMDPKLWDTYLALTSQERIFLEQHAGGALTLLVSPQDSLSHLAHDGRVGVRVVDHPLMARLTEAVGVPITATSANIAGETPCYNVTCIQKSFPGKDGTTYDLSLGCILDGGSLAGNTISTVALLTDNGIQVVRQGALHLHA